jgi:hypothetical protein
MLLNINKHLNRFLVLFAYVFQSTYNLKTILLISLQVKKSQRDFSEGLKAKDIAKKAEWGSIRNRVIKSRVFNPTKRHAFAL